MATVKMTKNVIDDILNNVYTIYTEELDARTEQKTTTIAEDCAKELYDLLYSKEHQDAIAKLPGWFVSDMYVKQYYVAVEFENQQSDWVFLPSAKKLIGFGNTTWVSIYDISAFSRVKACNNKIIITLKDDGQNLPDGALKGLLLSLHKKTIDHANIVAERTEAEETMKAFLARHKTLQSAVKEFGESLFFYVHRHYKAEYDRVTEKRKYTRKPKEETQPVNVDKLIVKATTHKLNI